MEAAKRINRLKSHMNASVLYHVTSKGLRNIQDDFNKLCSADRLDVLMYVKDEYHSMQRNITNPGFAADELVCRLMFELLVRKVSVNSLANGNWFDRRTRDSGHDERMVRLVKCILRLGYSRRLMKACKWLNFDKAVKARRDDLGCTHD